MKKILSIGIILVLFGIVEMLLSIVSQPVKVTKIISPLASIKSIKPQPVFAQEKATVFYPAVQVTIPKIELSAHVIPVGLDSARRMDVPNNFVEVGWYDLGAKPGEIGSTVLDGHSDDFHGNPAVFYNLDQLGPGDKIVVTDQSGKQYTYVVTEQDTYPVDGLPMQHIFAEHDKARLNMITCHGQWDSSIGTYNQRTVIYSELQS